MPPTRSRHTSTTWRRRSRSRGAASVNEGSAYSLTLGAVTDPGTDTVSSYVVHWGDGSSRHLHRPAASRRHTYADGPNDYDDHGRPDRRGRHLPRAGQRARRHGQQRGADDRDQRRRQRQRGLGLQPDPGRGHRPGHRHGQQLRRPLGRRQLQTPTPTAGAKTHTYADGPNDYTITVDLVDEDGTFLDAANALERHRQQRRADDRDQRRRQRERGLGLQPDPGRGHRSGHRHGDQLRRPLGRRQLQTPTPTDGAKTHTYADGPSDYDDHGRPGRRGRHLPRRRQRAQRHRQQRGARRSRSAAPPA